MIMCMIGILFRFFRKCKVLYKQARRTKDDSGAYEEGGDSRDGRRHASKRGASGGGKRRSRRERERSCDTDGDMALCMIMQWNVHEKNLTRYKMRMKQGAIDQSISGSKDSPRQTNTEEISSVTECQVRSYYNNNNHAAACA